MDKPALVNLVLDFPIAEEAYDFSTNEILDMVQDLPDEILYILSDTTVKLYQETDSVSKAMYSRLVLFSDQHEVIKENIAKKMLRMMESAMHPNQKHSPFSLI